MVSGQYDCYGFACMRVIFKLFFGQQKLKLVECNKFFLLRSNSWDTMSNNECETLCIKTSLFHLYSYLLHISSFSRLNDTDITTGHNNYDQDDSNYSVQLLPP